MRAVSPDQPDQVTRHPAGTANALPIMAQAAIQFRRRLRAEPDCIPLPVPVDISFASRPAANLHWDNELLGSRSFRRAHVETFEVPGRLSVLHVCILPHLSDPAPIFGFDMVAGPSRVTGIFLDLSPVGRSRAYPTLSDLVDPSALADFAVKRALPEWGDIFSNDMLAVRPIDLDEVTRAISLALKALDGVLAVPRPSKVDALPEVADGQARYIFGQRRNEHTLKMLASFIGPSPARRFIDEVLFPLEDCVSDCV